MQLDPYIHLQMHEQELRRKMTQNALEREWRASRENVMPVVPGTRYRTNPRPSRLAAVIGTLAVLTRAVGIGRHGV